MSNFLVGGGDSTVSTNKLLPNGVLVGTSDTQTLSNKSLDNTTVFHIDTIDNTKRIAFQTSGATPSTTLTMASLQNSSQTLNIPNITGSDTLVTTNLAQTIGGTKSLNSVSALISQNSFVYNIGTASQSGNTVTGVGTTWTSSMVGGLIIFANNVKAFITAFVSVTSLTIAISQTVSSQSYSLYFGGTQIGDSGSIGVVRENISSLTASQAIVSDASKNLVSLPYSSSSTLSSLVQRDVNANIFANNSIKNYTTTATSAGTTTLTSASSYYQYFTGTTTQNIILPITSTLATGFQFNMVNNSTGSITVQSSDLNSLQIIPSGSYAIFRCILASGTTLASWSVVIASSSGSSTTGAAGSTTQVQYNNSGSLAGSSGITIAADLYPILTDKTGTTPDAPSVGVKLFSRYRGGRRMTGQISSTDTSYSFQPAFFTNKIGVWSALGNNTSVQTINFGNSATGTATARNVTSNNIFGSMRRVGFIGSVTPGSSTGTRHNGLQFFISTDSTFGGFFYVARFGSSSNSTLSTQRYFIGLAGTANVLSSSTEISTNTDIIGFGMDSTDKVWYFMHSNSVGPTIKEPLVGTFPVRDSNTTMFEARIFTPAGTNIVYYSLEVLGGGSLYEGSITTNIPTATVTGASSVAGTLLSPQIFTNNGTTGSAPGIDVVSQYIESDN